MAQIYQGEVIDVAMCGDDDVARNGRLVSQGNGGNSECLHRIRAKAGVAEVRSDRLSVEELAPQTVSRPALALSRRQTRSE